MGLGMILGLVPTIMSIINRIVPDKDLQAKIEAELELAKISGQLDANVAEAQHESVFVAGWRPFVGWICGFSFAYHLIIVHIIQWIMNMTGYSVPLPHFDSGLMQDALFGMLGLGGLRTYEKHKRMDQLNRR